MDRQRLSSVTLPRARAGEVPLYDRRSEPTIAHLGVGAFARALPATYADDLLRRGWPALMRGVSVRSRRAEEQMAPQDGLYTLIEREPGREPALRVIGSFASVGTGTAAAVEAVAAPATSLVTLTITEKGYEPAAEDDPAGIATSVPGLLAEALARRRRAGLAPPVIASLDNLLGNGAVLADAVVRAASRLDPGVADWISEHVSFPSSVVDRMTPATTEHDLEGVAERLGLVDRAAVVTEGYRSWMIEEVDGLPPLGEAGVEVVNDVGPYERRKLWLLNGPHSALAYCGLLADCPTIAAAVTDERVSSFVRQLIDQVIAVADLSSDLAARTFADDTLRRFANPALGHTCVQVAADGSRKLPQRLLPVVAARRRQRLGTTGFAVVVAIWIAAAAGLRPLGADLPAIADPLTSALRAGAGKADLAALTGLAFGPDVDRGFAAEVASALGRLLHSGVAILEDRSLSGEPSLAPDLSWQDNRS